MSRQDLADIAVVYAITSSTDTENVIGCSDSRAGERPQNDIATPRGVVNERFITDGRVFADGGVR